MELILNAVIFNEFKDLEEFQIKVNDLNYQIVSKRLILEQRKIINLLKEFKEDGIIKSIYIPKNKKIQKDLDNLIRIKKEIKLNLRKIKEVFN